METSELIELKEETDLRRTTGVISITRGTFETPVAHLPHCRAVQRMRVNRRRTRYWWTPDVATAVYTLGARKCHVCLHRHRYTARPSPQAAEPDDLPGWRN